MNIIYEDNYLLVVNKEKGLLVHKTTFNEKKTLVSLLQNKIKVDEFVDKNRPGIIQRLDKYTNGLLVVAKNKFVAEKLSNQIRKKEMKRKYAAIVHNNIKNDEIIIDAPLMRNKKSKTTKMMVSIDKKAKNSITKVKVIEHFKNSSYIECELLTGRTHQIRAHLSYINHPIFNDSLYGCDDGYKNYGHFLTSY